MATAKTNYRPELAVDIIRPALVEAKLMTAKRAGDAAYVARLAEELHSIEGKFAALEEALHLDSEANLEHPSQKPTGAAPEGDWNAEWIRMKSGELDLRLRRIQQSGNHV